VAEASAAAVRVRVAKTKKGKRYLESRAPKLAEDPKKLMTLRGRKTSEVVKKLLVDLGRLKAGEVVKMSRNNDLQPFEPGGEEPLQFMCDRSDCSTFALGSTSKKRPHNLILGRMFDFHLLDLLEVGVSNFRSLEEFHGAARSQVGNKPCFVFAGQEFETKTDYAALKSMILDIFRGRVVDRINLKGLDRVISVVAADGVVRFRHYAVAMKKSGTKTPRVELTECGPRMDLTIRRHRPAQESLLKEAMRMPRTAGKSKIKNAKMDSLLGKVGRIYMPQQEPEKMATKKMKGVKRQRREEAASRKKARQDRAEAESD